MREKLLIILSCLLLSGCHLILPDVSHQPVIRNPFPQLSRIAVAPFFNHSDEPTLNSRDAAMAYFAELQATSGFEVLPLNVVEEAMIAHRIDLSGPGEARRLAQILNVDALVVGAVTDYSPYYPPRLGLHVEWYTANPGYHEIPVGYGLPWDTPQEEYIPENLVYEAEMALARAQLATQAPDCDSNCQLLPQPPPPVMQEPEEDVEVEVTSHEEDPFDTEGAIAAPVEELPLGDSNIVSNQGQDNDTSVSSEAIVTGEPIGATGTLPPSWPNESCFVPANPQATRPACVPSHGPVMKHTRIYHGTDPKITQALQSYVYFRDDARFGGWKAYLQRSDDFMRFCCHMHIKEMLSARGGSHKTRLVWRWP